MQYHPHVHCLVPGGGLAPDGQQWLSCRPDFFLHVHVLAARFRRVFLDALQAAFAAQRLQFFGALAPLADRQAFTSYLAPLREAKWIAYAKPPFGSPQKVLDYLVGASLFLAWIGPCGRVGGIVVSAFPPA